MVKHASIPAVFLSAATLFACAHAQPAPPPPERDWARGLSDGSGPSIAPIGPLDSDQQAYDYVRKREHEHALGSKQTAVDLEEMVNSSSQLLASSLALPLFKAGVFYGQPHLIDEACTSARRVTNSALQQSGNVEPVLEACAALAPGHSSNDACGEGQAKMKEAYSLLANDKSTEAGRSAAEAVRIFRDRCPRMTAPLRTPVDPASRGFLIVWTLHASDAPPVTWLAGEQAPNTADSINDGFLRGVQAVRPIARVP